MMTEGQAALVREAMRRHPESFADALGVDAAENAPAPLFQWLVGCLLASAPIAAAQAARAGRALFAAGCTTPEKMAEAGWSARAETLNAAGYARYDEKTSAQLGEMVDLLTHRWGGDLRALREEAERDPVRERRLIKSFKGIGDIGAALFLREVQVPWEELFPLADDRALDTARELGLPGKAAELAALVPREAFPRLLDALLAIRRGEEVRAVREAALG